MLLLAATTADEVFKSMGDSLDSDINPWHVVAVIAGVILLVVTVVLFNRRSQQQAKPKANNNIAKLNRQLAKASGLKARELKQLKLLAEQENVQNPLVLLLCPSVLKAAAGKRQAARG